MTEPQTAGSAASRQVPDANQASSAAPSITQEPAPQVHNDHLTPAEDMAPGRVQVSCPTADEVQVAYDTAVDRTGISDNAEFVLRQICSRACIRTVTISSGTRSVESQARAMYENAQRKGVASQRALYGRAADRVFDAYDRGVAQHQDAAQIQADMAEQINAVGPGNISHHIAQGPSVSTFDVAPSSVGGDEAKARFVREVLADSRVQRFFQPPADPGYHLEVNN